MPSRKRSSRALLPRRGTNRPRPRARPIADNPAIQLIWDAVAQLPRGTVSTYGEVARSAGLPGRARQAGYALKHLPPDLDLPWHRVVGAGGRIVFAQGSRARREQERRLRAEGVEVTNGRVARTALRDRLLGD